VTSKIIKNKIRTLLLFVGDSKRRQEGHWISTLARTHAPSFLIWLGRKIRKTSKLSWKKRIHRNEYMIKEVEFVAFH
jgi:hypothetical protein